MTNNLKSIRERLGLSQAALAEAIGMSQGNVSHCECGRQEFMPDAARKLIHFSLGQGIELSFDDIYSAPAAVDAEKTPEIEKAA